MTKTTILFSFVVLVLALALVGGAWADTCYTTSKTIPATCTGGTISSDTLSGGCRLIVCADGANSITAKACNKPGDYQPQFFEMYRTASAGTPPKVCLGTTCVQNNGFVKSGNFPICTAGGLGAGLVAYYGENGNHNDALGQYSGSEIVGEGIATTGKIGGSFYYGGLGNVPVDVGGNDPRVWANLPSPNAWPQSTTSFWMRRSLNNWGGWVLGYLEPNNGDYGHRYIYVGDDKIGYWVGDGGSNAVTITSAPISRAEWHHVVFQWDTTTQKSKLYVDGVFVGEESIAAFGPISDRLSWAAGVNGYGFNGRIDEIGVWNRVLNDAEITQLYNGGAGKAYPFN